MRAPTKVHFILFLINFIYSLNYVLVKEITPSVIHPLGLQVLRAAAGFLFFTLLFQFSDRQKVPLSDILKIAGCAFFGIAVNGMAFLKGISLTVPINASLIMIMVPILVMLISFALFRESIGSKKMIGILIGIIGAYILITKLQPLSFSKDTVLGDLFILTNATSFATYLVLVRQLMKKYNAITMARWLFTFGFLFVLPFGVKFLPEVHLSAIRLTEWLVFAFVLIFPTCLAYYLYNVALKTVSPTVASSYIFLQPLLTAVIALLLGKDHLDSYKIIGGALIFIGVYMVTFGKIPSFSKE